MTPWLYVVTPKPTDPTYAGSDAFSRAVGAPFVTVADLVGPSLAALAPPGFHVDICDEYLSPVDFATQAPFVGITGNISQWGRCKAIARRFRDLGKVVIIGGPFATLSPEVIRPYCDILVRGEFEEIAPEFFGDLQSGRWKDEYNGTQPDLALSPLPRWDLYPNRRALAGNIQTSRGCPFECEFCDAIEYLGRRQRHKPIARILGELDGLYRNGYRTVYISDDNFTVYRQRTKELLEALIHWNDAQTEGHVLFTTSVSIDAARDDELLDLCAKAGLGVVFVGLETVNEEALREVKKRQNVKVNMIEQTQRFLDRGIMVFSGMIVGFDADGSDIFDRQYEFARMSSIPLFTLSPLFALMETPLYSRLLADGRLVVDEAYDEMVQHSQWQTNVQPKQMTREALLVGLKRTCNMLYAPDSFGDRVQGMIRSLGTPMNPALLENIEATSRTFGNTASYLKDCFRPLGPDAEAMLSRVLAAATAKPAALPFAIGSLQRYLQVRYMYGQFNMWEPALASTSRSIA